MKRKIKAVVVLTLLLMLVVAIVWFGLIVWSYLASKSGNKPSLVPNVSISDSPLQLTAEQLENLNKNNGNLQPALVEQYINEYRGLNNLPALAHNGALEKSAELKLNDMIANNYFTHDSPSGLTPWYFMSQAGYVYKKAGENLAYGKYKDEKLIVDSWIASAPHKENLLNPDYKDFGLTIRKIDDFNGSKDVYVVVLHLAH